MEGFSEKTGRSHLTFGISLDTFPHGARAQVGYLLSPVGLQQRHPQRRPVARRKNVENLAEHANPIEEAEKRIGGAHDNDTIIEF